MKRDAYNKAHTSTRKATEQAFGWWKRRFHLIHSEVRVKPEKTYLVIGACGVLQNIAIKRNEPIDGILPNEDQPDITPYHGPENGKVVRDHVCNTF